MTRGRPIRGLFGGLFLGICIDLDLVFGGAVKLESSLLTILPAVLMVVVLRARPVGAGRPAPPTRRAAPLPSALPRPATWPDYAPPEGSRRARGRHHRPRHPRRRRFDPGPP